jgi:hypothetical protein
MASRNGAVHVATTKRVYKGKTYTTHLLRRSYRHEGKVKHQTLGNLSHLPPDLIDTIRRRLAGEGPPESEETSKRRKVQKSKFRLFDFSTFRLFIGRSCGRCPTDTSSRFWDRCTTSGWTRSWHHAGRDRETWSWR